DIDPERKPNDEIHTRLVRRKLKTQIDHLSEVIFYLKNQQSANQKDYKQEVDQIQILQVVNSCEVDKNVNLLKVRLDQKGINFVQFEASKISLEKKNELVVDLKQDDVIVTKSKVKGQLESKLIPKN
ncbi:MAG: hypothetical protein EZS28_036192, partial [Streblomastix strix]